MNAHKIKHTVIELLRNSTQLLVVAIILALPCLSLYAHYYSAKATEDFKYLPVFPGKILLYLDQYMSTLQNPQPFLESFKGSLWSMRFAGFDISDPLAAAEMLFASKTNTRMSGALTCGNYPYCRFSPHKHTAYFFAHAASHTGIFIYFRSQKRARFQLDCLFA